MTSPYLRIRQAFIAWRKLIIKLKQFSGKKRTKLQDRSATSSNLTERSTFFTLILFCFKMYKIYLRHTKILRNKSSGVKSIGTFEGIKPPDLAFSSSCMEMSTRLNWNTIIFDAEKYMLALEYMYVYIHIYAYICVPKSLKITYGCVLYL